MVLIAYFIISFTMLFSIFMILEVADSIVFRGFSMENFVLKAVGRKASILTEMFMIFAMVGAFIGTIIFSGLVNS